MVQRPALAGSMRRGNRTALDPRPQAQCLWCRPVCGAARFVVPPASSTLLGSGEGSGEPVECDGLAAQGAGAEDEGEDDLQFSQGLVEGHPGAGAFGSARIMVMKAWARAARVTWRCQPR